MARRLGPGQAAVLTCGMLAIVLVLAATPSAAAPAPHAALTTGPPPDLRIGFLQPVESLNPFIGSNEASFVLYGLLYDFPFSFDADGNYLPNLITSASCADPTCSAWNYTVRQGVAWSDGTELTAADVNFTWNFDSQHLPAVWAFEPYFNHVVVCTSLTRPACGAVLSSTNPWNVTLYFDGPFVAGRSLWAPILQMRQWSGVTPSAVISFANALPIGTGPFLADPSIYQELLDSVSTPTPLHLIRNPNYHAVGASVPSIAIANLYLTPYADPAAMTTALETGQLDLAQFTPSTIGPLRGYPNVEVQSTLQAIRTWNYLGISQCDTIPADSRLNRARFDVRVREALALATNKDAIVQSIYGGQGDRGSTLLSPIDPAWWYDPVGGGDNLTFDVAAANAILNQSGYTVWSGGSFGNGVRSAATDLSVSIQSSTGAFRVEDIANSTKTISAGTQLAFTLAVRPPSVYPEEYTTAQYLQQAWARIGVQVTIKPEATESALATDVYGCYAEMYIWYWSSDPDPNYMLSMESSWTLDGWNDNYWVNTSYNRLYLAQLGDTNLAQRETDAKAAEKLQYELAPMILLLYPHGEWAMRTDLWQGWGNWTAQPYLQMNAPWGANPLWSSLTCPSCTPIPPPAPPGAPGLSPAGSVSVFAGTPVSLTASSSEADPSVQLNFTADWGDGNATSAVTSGSSPSATMGHSWTVVGTYLANAIVYDGYNAPLWSTTPVTVNVVAASNPGYLAGTVTDTLGSPLAGASVVATPGNWATSTTSSGAYSLSLPAGTYDLTVSAPYATPVTVAGVAVAVGVTTTEDVVLALGLGWIGGTVVDAATGAPIAGASVLATSGGTQHAVASDAQGAFNLTVEPGTYTVTVSAAGYGSVSRTGVAATTGRTTTVDVALVPASNPVVLALPDAIGQPGQATRLTGNVTAPASGTWILDFGDGTNATGAHGAGTTALAVNHTYAQSGRYTIRLTATSYLASGTTTASAVIDGTPPSTTVELRGTEGEAGWLRSSVQVTLNATDDLSGVRDTLYRVDGGPMTEYTSPIVVSSDGAHTVDYYAVDRAGNAETLHTVAVDVDTTPPSIQLASPADGGVVSSAQVTVSWTGSDGTSGIAGYQVSVDNGPRQSVGTDTSFAAPLADGTHSVTVWAVDAAGNNASAAVTFRVDTNVFSPSGPYAGLPTYAIIVVAAVAVAAFGLWRRKAGRRSPPAPPPEPPGV